MNILEKIVLQKRREIDQLKRQVGLQELQDSVYFKKETNQLSRVLKDGSNPGIIAEFKRRSPSKGDINSTADIITVTRAYEQAGAIAISVLTDSVFFGALPDDFELARKAISVPLLRKEFIVDEYQVLQTKAMGADIILLIAACLDKREMSSLAKTAANIGLQVLIEVHTEDELEKINDDCTFIGINNRNLKTFKVDIENSMQLGASLPADRVKIAESGISNVETVHQLKKANFDGFLMGENFMKTNNPGDACRNFIQQLKK